ILRRARMRAADELQSRGAVRPAHAVWLRGEHCQADRLAGGVGRDRECHADARRHGLCQGDASGTAVARRAPVPLRSHLRADDPQFHRPAESGIAAVLLGMLSSDRATHSSWPDLVRPSTPFIFLETKTWMPATSAV